MSKNKKSNKSVTIRLRVTPEVKERLDTFKEISDATISKKLRESVEKILRNAGL